MWNYVICVLKEVGFASVFLQKGLHVLCFYTFVNIHCLEWKYLFLEPYSSFNSIQSLWGLNFILYWALSMSVSEYMCPSHITITISDFWRHLMHAFLMQCVAWMQLYFSVEYSKWPTIFGEDYISYVALTVVKKNIYFYLNLLHHQYMIKLYYILILWPWKCHDFAVFFLNFLQFTINYHLSVLKNHTSVSVIFCEM